MFGAPGSAACAAAAKANGTVPVTGQHCLLSGPDDNRNDLLSGLPTGVSASEGQILSCHAERSCFRRFKRTSPGHAERRRPNAQFFVLKDNVALRGSEITNPEQSSDPDSGEPDVTFGFTSKGQNEFQKSPPRSPTAATWSAGLGQTYNQHFAVALDNQLITVPYDQLQAVPGRDQRRQRRRHHRKLHDHLRAGPRE